MAVGHRVVSVFSGAADKDAYQQISLVPKERTAKAEHSERTRTLHGLYGEVRTNRENDGDSHRLVEIWQSIKADYPEQWLLPLEILELLEERGVSGGTALEIRAHLTSLRDRSDELAKLIDNGLHLLA